MNHYHSYKDSMKILSVMMCLIKQIRLRDHVSRSVMLQHLPVHHMPVLFIILGSHLIHYWGRLMSVIDYVKWDGDL